ncbi:MAG TPA: hypothetical protein VGD78_10730 [Chthoniobacterales bacterium]
MSRFKQAFLRDKLGGRVCLAAFGKHPAWDDHVGLLGDKTESLALLEDVLYRRGIAGQVAAGGWRDSRGGVTSVAFNHRFVWSRGEQSLVGVLWPSLDGKGRGQFPFVCCVQTGMKGAIAVQTYLDGVVQVGAQAREAATQSELLNVLARGGPDLGRCQPVGPALPSPAWTSERTQAARDALSSLAPCIARSQPTFPPFIADNRDAAVRLPPLDEQPSVRLWFYAGFVEQFSPASPISLLITKAAPAAPVDCVLGEPGPDAFFCLGAEPEALPVAPPPGVAALPERWQANIDGFLAACATGTMPVPARRRFWQRLS